MQFDRLESLMKHQGKSKKHMGEIVGKGGYYIKDCKTKGIQVPESIVRTWADDLDTTYEYLMGETDDPNAAAPAQKEKAPANEAEAYLRNIIALAERAAANGDLKTLKTTSALIEQMMQEE